MSVRQLFTSTGATVTIGHRIGKGGEGSVHQVDSNRQHVAKICNNPPDADKQDKLRLMATLTDPGISKLSAWPLDTLHLSPGGPMRGFLMPNASGYVPAHQIYNSGHRKQTHEELSWAHLVFIARNTAYSFSEVRKRGVVIGDVNENSVMIAPANGHVMLIDVDSFQVSVNGRVFPSLVGVPDFTPPELHTVSSFSQVTRVPNHDCFGLAILIFQLLLGGRHPFAGTPLPQRNDVGNDMSVDIRSFRFADAPDNSLRGLVAPPAAVPAGMLPSAMRAMFTQAFTEQGARQRPTAAQWVVELDQLRAHTRVCSVNGHHSFPTSAGSCPWCVLDRRGIAHFVTQQIAAKVQAAKIAIPALWTQISSIPPPAPIVLPPTTELVVIASALPETLTSKRIPRTVWPISGVLSVVAILVGFWPVSIALLVATGVWQYFFDKPRRVERLRRLQAKQEALAAQERVRREAAELGPEGFEAVRLSLAKLYDEYTVEIPKRVRQTLTEFENSVRLRQLQRHLERQYVDQASISGVGPALKRRLAAYGINTAADVNQYRIMEIPGFGPAKTTAVLTWRVSCEGKFRYNPSDPATTREREQSVAVHETRKRAIENALQIGRDELQRRRQLPSAIRTAMEQKLVLAARQVAQATADLRLMGL